MSVSKKVKKIIAREGLVIVGFVIAGAILGVINAGYMAWKDDFTPISQVERKSVYPIRLSDIPGKATPGFVPDKPTDLSFLPDQSQPLPFWQRFGVVDSFVVTWVVILWCYPLYWLGKFIVWAIRTLRGE